MGSTPAGFQEAYRADRRGNMTLYCFDTTAQPWFDTKVQPVQPSLLGHWHNASDDGTNN